MESMGQYRLDIDSGHHLKIPYPDLSADSARILGQEEVNTETEDCDPYTLESYICQTMGLHL
jgi:hypothetical protein